MGMVVFIEIADDYVLVLEFDFPRDGSSLEAARAILKALVIVTPQEDLLDFHQVLLRRTNLH